MEDRRLERFYLSLFKKSERKWRRIVWQANKKRYGNTPWDLAKKWGRNWRREWVATIISKVANPTHSYHLSPFLPISHQNWISANSYTIYMKGQAKKKGSIKKRPARSSQPRKENKEQRKFLCLLRGKGNSLPQSLYIGSAYKIKKKKIRDYFFQWIISVLYPPSHASSITSAPISSISLRTRLGSSSQPTFNTLQCPQP